MAKYIIKQIQAYLGDSVGLVPDHHNKANVAMKRVRWIFCFPSAYTSYVYTTLLSIKYAVALKTVYIL